MKKILAILLSTFALTVYSAENVTIIYSWTAADTAANYYRAMAESANRVQKKYNFIVDYKPGAGGAIAATHVAKTPNTILATSSAFFIRSNLYPESGYNQDNYKELLPVCFGPFGISSAKYKSWKEVPTNQHLTIGISGMGTTTHLTAIQIAKRYPNLDIIAFKSTSEAVMSALTGQTDFAVNLLGDSNQYETDNNSKSRLYVLGIGGTKFINNHALLIDQGFGPAMARMGSPAQLIVPLSVSDEKYTEWRKILGDAVKSPVGKKAIAEDFCSPTREMLSEDPVAYYNESKHFWKKMTNGIEVK
jgi:tripartite-type tricarboxylate transporter receptor subunit TctC